MKKVLLLCLSIVFTTPLLASGIDAGETSAPCDNTTLETYGGTANVEINWEPNTIQTRWYNGNTLIDTTNTNADSCVYDDVLNVPPTPTNRTGYTFMGWTVQPEMDFSTLTSLPRGNECFGKSVLDGEDWCGYNIAPASGNASTEPCDARYDDLKRQEWKVKTGNDYVYGMAKCAAKSGVNRVWNNENNFATTEELESVSGDLTSCWCMVTGYKNGSQNVMYRPQNTIRWVYNYTYSNSNATGVTACQQKCVVACGKYFIVYPDFCTELFTSAPVTQ